MQKSKANWAGIVNDMLGMHGSQYWEMAEI